MNKKMTLTAFVFPKLRTLKTWVDQCLKSPISEDASTRNRVNVPKHCWNLHHSIFIMFIGHWKRNYVRKSLSYWHAKSKDCLWTHWLPMKSILFLNRHNLTIPIQMQLSEKQKSLSEFFAAILKFILNFERFE